jgi:hypothetical protein
MKTSVSTMVLSVLIFTPTKAWDAPAYVKEIHLSFLHLVSANRKINDPEDPTQPGWGGQYVRVENTNHYVDGPGKTSISRWREDYQKEFKERADRCIKPKSLITLNWRKFLMY